jgi:hypothetical protein
MVIFSVLYLSSLTGSPPFSPLPHPADTVDQLLNLAKSASRLSERTLLSTALADLIKDPKRSTPEDSARFLGLLIRWLEDTVESPPRRAGATPEELADDYVYACVYVSVILTEVSMWVFSRLNAGPLYPSLPRPAQSAWSRLLTQHLSHLPLAAQILLANASLYIVKRSIHKKEAEALNTFATATLFPRIISGDLFLDIGCGARKCYGIYAINVVGGLAERWHLKTEALFPEESERPEQWTATIF